MVTSEKLLLDGLRIILQILVDRVDGLEPKLKEEIQDWYDRCYTLRQIGI
jgi:hypothetical protein